MNYSLFGNNDSLSLEESLNASFEGWIDMRARSTSKQRSEKALSAETANVYREMWHAFAAYCAQRNLRIEDITVEDIETFFIIRGTGDDFQKPRMLTKGDDLSPRYARRFLTLMDRVFRFQASQDDVDPNTAAHELLQLPQYKYAEAADKDPLPEYLTEVQAKRVIAYVTQVRGSESTTGPMSWKDVRDRTAVALMLGGGLAPGDVRALEISGVITVGGRRADIPWKLALPGNGNSPARETPLATWAGRQLAYWLSIRQEHKIPGDYVFPSTASGKEWSHTRCFEACKDVLTNAGISTDSGGLFKLRHTFALRQLAKGKSEVEVARWLGLLDLSGMTRYRRIVMSQVDVV